MRSVDSNFPVSLNKKSLFCLILNYKDAPITTNNEVHFILINVTRTIEKVCMQSLTPPPPPPFGITFYFLATVNFTYGPFGSFNIL